MTSQKILLVDDSGYMRGILKKILRAEGYREFVEASNGVEAVELYAKETPSLVLMDIIMPEKNGLDALRDIRREDPSARVVMVTAVGQDVIMDEAKQAGACGFVVKPFSADQVRETVLGALE